MRTPDPLLVSLRPHTSVCAEAHHKLPFTIMHFVLILALLASWAVSVPVIQPPEGELANATAVSVSSVLNLAHRKKKYREYYGDYDYEENDDEDPFEDTFDDVDGSGLTSHYWLQLLEDGSPQKSKNNESQLAENRSNEASVKAALEYLFDKQRIQKKPLVKSIRNAVSSSLSTVRQVATGKKNGVASPWDRFFKIFEPATRNWAAIVDPDISAASVDSSSSETQNLGGVWERVKQENGAGTYENGANSAPKLNSTNYASTTPTSTTSNTLLSPFSTTNRTIELTTASLLLYNYTESEISQNEAVEIRQFSTNAYLTGLLAVPLFIVINT